MARFASLRFFSVAIALLLLVAVGCDGSEGDGGEAFDGAARTILEHEARGVIGATYRTLTTDADTLRAAVDSFVAVPETVPGDPEATDSLADLRADALDAARAAWRSAHRPWEQSEAFYFGAVAHEDFDTALDVWPADTLGIRAVLEGDAVPIDAARVATLGSTDAGARKGFHAVEFLLFGAEGEKAPEDFTPRATSYLSAAVTVLADDAEALEATWSEAAGDFTGAGTPGSAYVSQHAALDSLARQMVRLASELSDVRLGAALESTEAFVAESAYSGNAFADFRNGLRGIRHVYTGDYAGREGPGLDEIVRDVQPALDEQIQSRITRAVTTLSDLQGSRLREALEDDGDRADVEAAQERLRDLRDLLQTDLPALLADFASTRDAR